MRLKPGSRAKAADAASPGQVEAERRGTVLMLLEVLNFLFVLLGLLQARERAQVSPLACRLIFLA